MKALDPEIKAIRRLDRAVRAIPLGAEQRTLEWLIARQAGLGAIRLPPLAALDPKAETPKEEHDGD